MLPIWKKIVVLPILLFVQMYYLMTNMMAILLFKLGVKTNIFATGMQHYVIR
jgi:hypothetical protein